MKDLGSLPARTAEGVLVVVETPAGARVKLKFDPELGQISLSRPLPLGLHYPFDWGFIPSTKAEDGDPLDAMLHGTGPGQPGAVVPGRLLGVLKVEQNRKEGPGRQRNDRLFLAPMQAAHGAEPRDVFAFPERLRSELEDFFLWSTRWEQKDLRFLGWGGIDEAETILSAAERSIRG
ncbi:MAG TPA: inorganic diphosphatase [Myxococcaceae bacterium]|nr:inorganic diphosphatase [Myxococcaceae bacterium]